MLNFIVNIKSGYGRGNRNLKKITRYCRKHKIEHTIHITNSPGHATRIATALVDNNSSTIVAVGGDGTFHEVLNGIYSFEKTALGFIPSGRGNDYARAANISTNPITALKYILRGDVVYTDYIQVGDKKCLNVAGTGLDVDVLLKVAGRRGKFSYIKSLLYCMKHFDPYKVETTVDGKTEYHECIMIGVCNGIAIGGNMRLSPNSRINDGQMNIVIISMPADGKLMKVLPKFLKGKHIDMPITNHFLCEEIDVKLLSEHPVQIDGEIYYNHPFNCKIAKGGIKTFSTLRLNNKF